VIIIEARTRRYIWFGYNFVPTVSIGFSHPRVRFMTIFSLSGELLRFNTYTLRISFAPRIAFSAFSSSYQLISCVFVLTNPCTPPSRRARSSSQPSRGSFESADLTL
jgi:hypothetical protein